MGKINWKVRLKNKMFWLTLIPALIMLAYLVLKLFGIEFDYVGLTDQVMEIFGTLFAILGLIGIVNDPTTSGLSDSEQALTYDKPKGE